MAKDGTLFIDEVGDISPRIQVKLLRVLQSKEFNRVGGTQIIKSNFRLITATNANLEQKIQTGEFREDLFYRLNVIPVMIPPLRERKDDILPLANLFIRNYTKQHKTSSISLSEENIRSLTNYDWPGNIRELRNIMERFVLIPNNISLVNQKNNSVLVLNENIFTHMKNETAQSDSCEQIEYQNINFNREYTLEELKNLYFEYMYLRKKGVISGKNSVAEALGISKNSAYMWASRLKLKERIMLTFKE